MKSSAVNLQFKIVLQGNGYAICTGYPNISELIKDKEQREKGGTADEITDLTDR
jgi:hypothetical protein